MEIGPISLTVGGHVFTTRPCSNVDEYPSDLRTWLIDVDGVFSGQLFYSPESYPDAPFHASNNPFRWNGLMPEINEARRTDLALYFACMDVGARPSPEAVIAEFADHVLRVLAWRKRHAPKTRGART